jgi:thioredoxin 1
MPHLRSIAAGLALVLTAASPATAAEFRAFDQPAFAAALAEGRPVLVDVHAWWCPVCASQNHSIKRTVIAPKFDRLIVFRLDYDKQKAEWKGFGVRKQATLIAFRGGHEVGRLAYVTDKDRIDALLASAVQ